MAKFLDTLADALGKLEANEKGNADASPVGAAQRVAKTVLRAERGDFADAGAVGKKG